MWHQAFGNELQELDGVELHALCLTHMSRFMLEPTAQQAARVCRLLEALSWHDDALPPRDGCDPYRQARAIWWRVAEHVESREDLSRLDG